MYIHEYIYMYIKKTLVGVSLNHLIVERSNSFFLNITAKFKSCVTSYRDGKKIKL